jgi:glutamate dehydrogenase/leucine dehydrogenase
MAFDIRLIPTPGYEQVVAFDHENFQCIIAIHSTRLGPALGGCRVKPYRSWDDALADALRLAKGMSYKSSLAGLNLGGGKCVVIAERTSADIMRRVGEAVNYFQGRYITAEDAGTTLADVRIAAEITPFAVRHDGSAMTARGVFGAITAAVRWLGEWGDNLEGLQVWVEGVGKVGMDLAQRLREAGSDLYVTDMRPEAVQEAVQRFQATALSATDARFMAVYAPCALGPAITAENVKSRANSIICGSANNQLADDELADVLHRLGALYVPDFLANAGGVIGAACEIDQPYDEAQAETLTDAIGERTRMLLEVAKMEHVTPLAAANMLAETRLL